MTTASGKFLPPEQTDRPYGPKAPQRGRGRRLEQRDIENEDLLFNCSLYFADSPTDTRRIPSLDVYDEVSSMLPQSETFPTIPKVRILGRALYDILRRSPALKAGTTVHFDGTRESFRDFLPTEVFRLSARRKDRRAEVWLAAYIGYYIGNCLSYLNDVLQRVQIEPETHGVKTTLLVKWQRITATLGGLAGFQVLFGLVALLYCRRGYEIVDGVPTYSSMFRNFPLGSEEEEARGCCAPGHVYC